MALQDRPLKFVQGIRDGEHAVLFYEDPDYAERIEFQFLKTGLSQGDSCMLTTFGETAPIERRMKSSGIDVDRFSNRDRLHVIKIPDPADNPRGVNAGIKENYDTMFGLLESPFRVVSTSLRNFSRKSSLDKELELERKAQQVFDGRDEATKKDVFRGMEGSVMCTYFSPEFGARNQGWFPPLAANHHAMIFAPKEGAGIAMRLRKVGEAER